MRIYMDMNMTKALGVTYDGPKDIGKEYVFPISTLIEERRKSGSSYDAEHMSFFDSLGIQKNIKILYTGYGWFNFISAV